MGFAVAVVLALGWAAAAVVGVFVEGDVLAGVFVVIAAVVFSADECGLECSLAYGAMGGVAVSGDVVFAAVLAFRFCGRDG